MKFRFAIPIAYFILSLALLLVFGGAGHGWGIEAFYCVSLPAALLVQEREVVVIWVLVAGILQWGVVGCVIDRFVRKR